MAQTVFRSCSLCEAGCGLAFEVEDNRILSVRADEDDVFSRGFICPKGVAIADVHSDADRIRVPQRRRPDGSFEPISWDEAFAITTERLGEIRRLHGTNAVAIYYGNPIIHNYGALILRQALLETLATRNVYSASSQDTAPRFATSYYLYGNSLVTPVPDVDRCDYFLCIGANPLVSNGSALTAPNMRARIRAIRERGGRVVIVDPRRTETAQVADEHVSIRPGGDAAFLLALTRVLLDKDRVDRAFLDRHSSGWATIEPELRAIDLEQASRHCGIPLATIERLALEFAAAPRAAAYSRIGTCNNRYGTLATYATDLLNAAAGRLGREGGAMFPTPAFDGTMVTRMPGADGHARWHSRVRGLPETLGDLPAACLAEEIETPGDGQVRAVLTFAGNPVLSTPNGRRLATALEKVEFMVSIDLYLNETTRFADIVFPSAWSMGEDHVDLVTAGFAVRNHARWSPPVLAAAENERADWQILLEIIERLGGGPTGVRPVDAALRLAKRFGYRFKPSSMLDLLLRLGPHGDRFLPWRDGLTLEKLRAAPHGIDLGPMRAGFERIFHRDRRVHLDVAPFRAALAALRAELAQPADDGALLLIGRRELRTCNSWMHNVPALVAGRDRCVLYVHPDDAARAGVADGAQAVLESRVHRGDVTVQINADLRPGVVSLPHGWGHAASAPWQSVAGAHAGVSANDWTDDQDVESVVGQSILNGVPVRLSASAA